jgi:hypothetical protein
MSLRFLLSIAACFATAIMWSPQPASALAHPCPGGPGANEVQVGYSGGGNGIAPVMMCEARAGSASAPAPAPTYYYIYGSIAWHPDVDDVWMVGNYSSPYRAEREAMAACQRAMGGGCASIGEWHNSSMAIVRDRSGILWSAWNGNGGAARKQLLADCSSKQPLPCEVVGSYSSGKRSSFPNLSLARKKYASAAWVNGTDGYDSRLYISGGHDSWQAAENASIATCTSATGRKCGVLAFAANGVIQTYQLGENNHSATAETSAKRARQAARSMCKKQEQRCALQVGYDSRTQGLVVHDFLSGKAVGR